MFIASQYYRPPFPEKKYWQDDFKKIKDSGLDAVQLWAIWGWIEAEPDIFHYEDYDQLMELADKTGLKVIISTIAEIHPFWIHRLIPDSPMITHKGRKVISRPRRECNVGLTPGGCTDNPKVLERMGQFLQNLADHFGSAKHLMGWDCWNETRWSVHADGLVCYCEHTVNAFREWLKEKYKSIEALNINWKRRYCSWDDVFPGKEPDMPYTQNMEFLRFLTYRAKMHMKFRYDQIRKADKKHIISAHCAAPAVESTGHKYEQTLSRGNDWDFAGILDGFGCSHFPAWGDFDHAHYGLRLEAIRSANQGKEMWISELQGGSARIGFSISPSVQADRQQLWIWNGFARGVKGVIFWCWRDEVFGAESSGFGLAGYDGFADQRLEAIKKSMVLLQKHKNLLKEYQPESAKIAVLFEPDNYYLNWSEESNAEKAGWSLLGYALALERMSIPYKILETSHPGKLNHYKIIILPWPLVIKEEVKEALLTFVQKGGVLLCEAELDAYTTNGFYQYPGKERKFAYKLGIEDKGRRELKQKDLNIRIFNKKFKLKPDLWQTPLVTKKKEEIFAISNEKNVLGVIKQVEKGRVYALGSFFGFDYLKKHYHDFEKFLYEIITQENCLPEIQLRNNKSNNDHQLISGTADDKNLLFVFNFREKKKLQVSIPKNRVPAGTISSIKSEKKIKLELTKQTYTFSLLLEKDDWEMLYWK